MFTQLLITHSKLLVYVILANSFGSKIENHQATTQEQ
jgi:hypothetical protein